jgi:hypothetical protein
MLSISSVERVIFFVFFLSELSPKGIPDIAPEFGIPLLLLLERSPELLLRFEDCEPDLSELGTKDPLPDDMLGLPLELLPVEKGKPADVFCDCS